MHQFIFILHTCELESDHHCDLVWSGTRQRRHSAASDEGPNHGVAVPTVNGVDDALLLVLGMWQACEKDTQQLKAVYWCCRPKFDVQFKDWTRLLTHWGRATHICVGKLTSIGSDNGLSPGRRQAIIWTIAGILLIGPLGTNISEILIGIQTFSFKKMHLKMSSAKWRPFVSASMS